MIAVLSVLFLLGELNILF